MRILLAAANARKGDLDANLALHLAVLDQARAQGCHLAVFPELSLTGSVDPRRHPGRALPLDAAPVRALVEATSGPGCSGSGGARIGITLCAEGEVDVPWDDAAAGGAQLVLFCSAPGLDGRRTDERGWRDGHAWWVSSGLGDAVRHARRLGLPVAMATQGRPRTRTSPGWPRWCPRPVR